MNSAAQFRPNKTFWMIAGLALLVALSAFWWLYPHGPKVGSIVTGSGTVVSIYDERGSDGGMDLYLRKPDGTIVRVVVSSTFSPCDAAAIDFPSSKHKVGAIVDYRGEVEDGSIISVCWAGSYAR